MKFLRIAFLTEHLWWLLLKENKVLTFRELHLIFLAYYKIQFSLSSANSLQNRWSFNNQHYLKDHEISNCLMNVLHKNKRLNSFAALKLQNIKYAASQSSKHYHQYNSSFSKITNGKLGCLHFSMSCSVFVWLRSRKGILGQ